MQQCSAVLGTHVNVTQHVHTGQVAVVQTAAECPTLSSARQTFISLTEQPMESAAAAF